MSLVVLWLFSVYLGKIRIPIKLIVAGLSRPFQDVATRLPVRFDLPPLPRISLVGILALGGTVVNTRVPSWWRPEQPRVWVLRERREDIFRKAKPTLRLCSSKTTLTISTARILPPLTRWEMGLLLFRHPLPEVLVQWPILQDWRPRLRGDQRRPLRGSLLDNQL